MMRLKRFYSSNPLPLRNRYRLLRNFTAISLGGFVITTGLLSLFYRQQAVRNLVISTEESNVALTQVFANTLWPEYGSFLSSTGHLTPEALAASDEIRQLKQTVVMQVEGLSVAKVKFYDLKGRTAFSTEASQIGYYKDISAGLLRALEGKPISQIGHRDTFESLQDNTLTDRDLLASYVPIFSKKNASRVVGVAEIYTDVTPALMRLNKTQYDSLLVSLLLLTVLYGILIVFVRRAEEQLNDQYWQVQSSEGRYRQQTHELEKVLADLKRTQAHMLQSEKMSSLGSMVAGVAHEINNPINFVHANVEHVMTYMQELLGFLSLYETHYPNPHEEIRAQADALEIDFVKKDLEDTLTSMEIGTTRIQDIVLSLRNFSRLDESNQKRVNVHEGIESTLMILQHQLKVQGKYPAILVSRDYDDLPLVECYPGQLNQVFMHILSNSIDALRGRFDSDETVQENPHITIRTQVANESVVLSFADNGCGFAAAVQSRLFDPFFTTKDVGEGTGMGLAISYQIVSEQHHGKITCFSAAAAGTEFVVKIPIMLEA
ncbi:MAG: ATP-binding protein [Cyanobacteria bacterium J06634_6]